MTLARLRVLVVDDNVDIATSLAKVVAMWGCEVLAAHDGTKAEQIAQTFEPHVLLLDIGMPGMNGWELARRIRKSGVCQRSVFVAITGFGLDFAREGASRERFDHHFAKPLDFAALKKILDAVASAELAQLDVDAKGDGSSRGALAGTAGSSSPAQEALSEIRRPADDQQLSPDALNAAHSPAPTVVARSEPQDNVPGESSTP